MTDTTTAAGLTFVDELPEATPYGRANETARRAQALRDDPEHRWAMWPSKATPTAVLKSLSRYGEQYETTARLVDGKPRTFARWSPFAAARQPAVRRPSGAAGPGRVQCPHCRNFQTCMPDETDADRLQRHYEATLRCRAAEAQRGRKAASKA